MLLDDLNKHRNTIKGVLIILAMLSVGGLLIVVILKAIAFIFNAVFPVVKLLVVFGFWGFLGYFAYNYFRKNKHEQEKRNASEEIDPNVIRLQTRSKPLTLGNPYRGIFVIGAAGSGKSESIAVPLLSEFIRLDFAGLVYDFKFPTLANDVESYLRAKGSRLRHFYLDFNNPSKSYRVNPISPRYLLNTSYAREFAQAIIVNLMKEGIKHPDFWIRSATDLLTACIWYLKEERPEYCDIPHAFAMVTSNDTALLKLLQTNPQTEQMTMSIYNAMERGADGQVSGVIGSLQSAIAQINTPELMYIFGGEDFCLDVNDPKNPILLTVGSYPTLSQTFAPLCSLVMTVAIKLMNQPGKHRSFFMIDEAPTVFIPGLEILPNTGRSNKIATVIMCQDLAQLTDGYGREKADVLFAACNSHFYGRVSSSITAERLSRQFGKEDKVYTTASQSRTGFTRTAGQSESVQERDAIKPADFLRFEPGKFAGIAVESNIPFFLQNFQQADRPEPVALEAPQATSNPKEYYNRVREEIRSMLSGEGKREPDEVPQSRIDRPRFKGF
jgi:type IV secretory pathway TraG/TraD family ATPase VirD4